MSPFPADSTDAEKKLFEAAKNGNLADYSTGNKERDDPANGGDWGSERTIRAEVIRALAAGDNPQVHAKGVQVWGARIIGPLELQGTTIPHRLGLLNCFIDEPLLLMEADALSINLAGSHVTGIIADGLRARSAVSLCDGFRATGAVRLPGAKIGALLNCSGGTFENAKSQAFNAGAAVIDGSAFLRKGFHAIDEVQLLGVKIRGQLDCSGGIFENADGDALNADSATVDGHVLFSGGFEARGHVRLVGAKIGGQLVCVRGKFENAKGCALSADDAEVHRSIFLRDGFHAKGEVRLPGANVAGQLDCSGGIFENADGDALSADDAEVHRSIFLRDGFHAKGKVRLPGARIGGDLGCSGGTFENARGIALLADRAKVDGSVLLDMGFLAVGSVQLTAVRIGGYLVCSGGAFVNAEGEALSLERASMTSLFLRELREPPAGVVDLAYSNVGEFVDDEKSWPENGKLILTGFVYGRLAGTATPWQARERLRWLALQPRFHPQPYDQLVRALKDMGQEQEAREVAIEKQEQLRKHGGLGPLGRFSNWVLGLTIAHGYKPERAMSLLILVWLIGTAMFALAERKGVIVPSDSNAYAWYQGHGQSPPEYPSFNPALYALDVVAFFLPAVFGRGIDLQQNSKWHLRERSPGDPWYWVFETFYLEYFALCWALVAIAGAVLSGQLKPR